MRRDEERDRTGHAGIVPPRSAGSGVHRQPPPCVRPRTWTAERDGGYAQERDRDLSHPVTALPPRRSRWRLDGRRSPPCPPGWPRRERRPAAQREWWSQTDRRSKADLNAVVPNVGLTPVAPARYTPHLLSRSRGFLFGGHETLGPEKRGFSGSGGTASPRAVRVGSMRDRDGLDDACGVVECVDDPVWPATG